MLWNTYNYKNIIISGIAQKFGIIVQSRSIYHNSEKADQ